MKIIVLIGQFPQLSETFIIRKAIGLRQAGHEVLIMSRRKGDPSLMNSFHTTPLKIEYLIPDEGPFGWWEILQLVRRVSFYFCLHPIASLRVVRLCRNPSVRRWAKQTLKYLPFCDKENYDIVHAEFLSMGYRYRQVPQMVKVKYFVSGRGTELNLLRIHGESNNFIETMKGADKVHVVSERMRQGLIQAGIPENRIFVNRPALTLSDFPDAGRAEREVPVIISVGRLVWIKGYDYLLAAFVILKQRGIPFRARIVGDGPLRNELQFSITDLLLGDHVELVGALSPADVTSALGQSDVFVLSSHAEGINNATLEAMAMSLAVVSTRCGGMEEVIADGVDGLLVSVRDPVAMASALEALLQSWELRHSLGHGARQKIERQFSMQRQVATYEKEYNDSLAVRT